MSKLRRTMQEAMQAAVAAGLCGLMAVSPALAEVTAAPATAHPAALTQQQKTLHALNRLTFGPRPGDEAAVAKMGLERWFELQLHPERIDDAAFDGEMAKFPAMQLTQAELLRRFPSPQVLREMARNDAALPGDPVERAIYADAEYAYKEQVNKQAAAGLRPNMPPNEADAKAANPAGETGFPYTGSQMSPGGTYPVTKAVDPMDSSLPAARVPAAEPDLGSFPTTGTQMMPATMAATKGKAGKKELRKSTAMDAMSVEAVLALAPEERVERLVAMSPQEMMTFRNALKPYERVQLMQGLTPAQMEIVAAMQAPVRVVGAEVLETRLLRDVYSQRQLQAVMTDFWLNHFSVYLRKNQNEPYYLPDYQNNVVLPNAMGKFEDLLVATAKSPAMLLYLDNWESIGPDSPAAAAVDRIKKARPNGAVAKVLPQGINENYARELMELHTLGVGGGYTQKDVIEVAKCFTGWTIDRPYAGAKRKGMGMDEGQPGTFVFMPLRHEPGPKTVLGHVIPEGGMNEGLEVLHILATSPATAHFVSQKLAVRFVSDTPPPALVDRMAATFLKTNGDIKAVLTTMFHSPEFWSPTVYRAKVKTPIEFMASALRASDAQVNNALPLIQAMERLGMPVYGMQTPNGYSWKADDWVSSNALISRMNFALVLSGDRVPGTRTNWPTLLGDSADTSTATSPSPATEKQLEALLLGQPAAQRTRQTVLEQFNNPTAQHQAEQSFNAPTTDPGTDDQGQATMLGDTRLLRAKASKGGRGGRDLLSNQPETPLDTMAGLLLGSPDFQRR